MCDGNTTQEQIVDDLAEETEIEKTEINKAVSGILTELEQVGLVQKI